MTDSNPPGFAIFLSSVL